MPSRRRLTARLMASVVRDMRRSSKCCENATSLVTLAGLFLAVICASASDVVQRDMASAYALADLVVEAGLLTDVTVTGRVATATMKVQVVYKGAASTGQVLRLALSGPWPSTNATVITHEWPREIRLLSDFGPTLGCLLFLKSSSSAFADYVGESIDTKLVYGKHILHYSKSSSFAPFFLTMQAPERIALFQGEDYAAAALRRDLTASIQYYQAFERTRDTADPLRLQRFVDDPLLAHNVSLTSWIVEQAREIMHRKGMVVGHAQPAGGGAGLPSPHP
jgi:hypothetical protein